MAHNNEVIQNINKCLVQFTNGRGISDYTIQILEDDFKGTNYMGKISRVLITGKREGGTVERKLILKRAPHTDKVRTNVPIKRYFKREIHSYTSMLPALEELQNDFCSAEKIFTFVKCYGTDQREPNEFLLLEDVSPGGFAMVERKKPLDIHHIRLIITKLACFHSLSFALKHHKPDLYTEISNNVNEDVVYSEQTGKFISYTIENALVYLQNSQCRQIIKKHVTSDIAQSSVLPETCHPYNVLCHGDFWQNNILFKYKEGKPTELHFVDWQLVKHCSPVVDISQILYSATDESLRRDHFQNLLQLYYDTLGTSLQKLKCNVSVCYPMKVFQEQVKQILPFGLVYAFPALTFLLRADDNIDDLECTIDKSIKNNEFDFHFRNKESADQFSCRLEGVINDFLKMGYFQENV